MAAMSTPTPKKSQQSIRSHGWNHRHVAPVSYDGHVTTTTRQPLTRGRIIEAAVDFADSHGIDELSMRKLADGLEVGPMALYNHVENKDDIHDGMIDHVFTSIALPDDDSDWKESMREIGASAMDVFGAHPWVVYLLMQRGNFGPGALAFMDRLLGLLRNAGFSDEDTQHAWQMLASHTMGYAFQLSANPGFGEKDHTHLQMALIEMGQQLPHVVAIAPLLAECDYETEYMFGLEIIIDGLEARLD